MHTTIIKHISQFFTEKYQTDITDKIQLSETKKEFVGDFTFIVFPFVALAKIKPEALAEEIGSYLLKKDNTIKSYNIIKGFLNLEMQDSFWLQAWNEIKAQKNYGTLPANGKKIMIEYCGPNTNKPLHLGHVRNIVIGHSMIKIYEANGYQVIKANIINDRGVHICKSMYAWMKNGNAETPASTGMKGDHFVGKYYVEFEKILQEESRPFIESGMEVEKARAEAPCMQAVQQMLVKWEQGDEEIRTVWKTMNSWVLAGFQETYKSIGISFDIEYFESDTYLLGKKYVEEGLAEKKFFQKENNSIWVDLSEYGLDHKLLLRGDGTSVYITQDIGTAVKRFEDYAPLQELIYVVGNEQEYHFKVLKYVLKVLGKDYWDKIYHLSYGMVELPEGKMKSREGTVVDADDLIADMQQTAQEMAQENGKAGLYPDAEQSELYRKLGLGALKYFLLKVTASKNFTFNPKESVELHGNTGVYLQYTCARIQSVLRNIGEENTDADITIDLPLEISERQLIVLLAQYQMHLESACREKDPSLICNYLYNVARHFNKFYTECNINLSTGQSRKLRVSLCHTSLHVLTHGLSLLGIEAPERM